MSDQSRSARATERGWTDEGKKQRERNFARARRPLLTRPIDRRRTRRPRDAAVCIPEFLSSRERHPSGRRKERRPEKIDVFNVSTSIPQRPAFCWYLLKMEWRLASDLWPICWKNTHALAKFRQRRHLAYTRPSMLKSRLLAPCGVCIQTYEQYTDRVNAKLA